MIRRFLCGLTGHKLRAQTSGPLFACRRCDFVIEPLSTPNTGLSYEDWAILKIKSLQAAGWKCHSEWCIWWPPNAHPWMNGLHLDDAYEYLVKSQFRADYKEMEK